MMGKIAEELGKNSKPRKTPQKSRKMKEKR